MADDAELGVEVVGLVEGPPVHLDRFVGPVLAGQRLGQGEDDLGVVGVDPDGPAQGVEPFLGPAEPEAELGEELIVVGVTRRGGQQVAAGLEGGVDPAQPGFELGDARQVLGAIAAVDLGQPPQGVGGVAQAAGRLTNAGGQGPGRDRAGVDRDRPVGGADRLGELGVGLQVTGQHAPALGRGVLVAVQLLAQRFDSRASRPAAWSFLTRASRTASFSSSLSASLAAAASCASASSYRSSRWILGQLESEAEVVFLERDGLGQGRRWLP